MRASNSVRCFACVGFHEIEREQMTNFPMGTDTFPSGAVLHVLNLDGSPYVGAPVNPFHSYLEGDQGDAITAMQMWLLAGNPTVGLNGAITAQLDSLGGITRNY